MLSPGFIQAAQNLPVTGNIQGGVPVQPSAAPVAPMLQQPAQPVSPVTQSASAANNPAIWNLVKQFADDKKREYGNK
jgi:hypothetical protein